jgi:hypothetical protein
MHKKTKKAQKNSLPFETHLSCDSLLVFQAIAGDALIGLEKLHWTVASLDPKHLSAKPGGVFDNIQAERSKIESALKELAVVYEYLLTGKLPK